MSKRELKKYIAELTKEQLEEQLLDLYVRFASVKEYYDFAFSPNENELVGQCRALIRKEYFPAGGRRAKARRSVAQKWIKKLKLLGADAPLLADVMFFNIETALAFSARRSINHEAFFTSMYKSFDEALRFVAEKGLLAEFNERIEGIVNGTWERKWPNKNAFESIAGLYLNK